MISKYEFVSLTTREIMNIHDFMYTHCVIEGCHRGDIRIKFDNGGGIGSGLQIKCKRCKVTEDITDYDCW